MIPGKEGVMVKSGLSLKELCRAFPKQEISLRRRFFLFLITCLGVLIGVLLLLLTLFGILNPADSSLEQSLTQQLDYSTDRISRNMEQLAAHSVDFSREMTAKLQETGMPFDWLRNNPQALTALQQSTYSTVLNHMRLADCSGAFFLLDTTVNDGLADTYYSGIYLKYANVGSDSTFRNAVCMFRGNPQVARQNNINLFSTWEYEMKENTFPQLEAVLTQSQADPARGYRLTSAYQLPDAWEHVRFLCTPITDDRGEIIGVCGFELSDPFFEAQYSVSDGAYPYMVCALLEEENGIYTGQLARNQSGYMPRLKGGISVKSKNAFSYLGGEDISLVGKMQDVQIGNSLHTVAVMLPEAQYQACVRDGQYKLAALFLIATLLTLGAGLEMSRRYVRPLIHSMEKIKEKQFDHNAHIREINDLFAFLAQQDRLNEETFDAMRRENANMQTSLEEMQTAHSETVRQVERLAYSRKDEVDPDDYEDFKNGLKFLTEREREILDLYIAGKTVKDIVELTGLKETTVRFHNRNIYTKLGVHSLKQLLRFCTILQQEEGNRGRAKTTE